VSEEISRLISIHDAIYIARGFARPSEICSRGTSTNVALWEFGFDVRAAGIFTLRASSVSLTRAGLFGKKIPERLVTANAPPDYENSRGRN